MFIYPLPHNLTFIKITTAKCTKVPTDIYFEKETFDAFNTILQSLANDFDPRLTATI